MAEAETKSPQHYVLTAERQFISTLNAARETFIHDYCDGRDACQATWDEAADEANRAHDLGEALGKLLAAYSPGKADEYLVLFTESMDAIEGAWPGPVVLAAARLAICRASAQAARPSEAPRMEAAA